MRNFIQQYRNLDETIRNEYASFGLRCLSEVKFNDEHALSFFTHLLQEVKSIKPFHFYKNYNEIATISDDIKYFTALTFLLRQFVNSPLDEDKTYHQTLEDKRYMSYANILFQSFYNYWDRIGDMIFSFIKTSLKERQVYFTTVLEKIDSSFIDSEYFIALKIYIKINL